MQPREDKDFSTPSTSQFSGLTQGLFPLGKYNRKFFSLQSRLKASDAEPCSFYKLGLNKFLQEFLVHHNLLDELEPLIRELVKWNQRYLPSKTHPPYNLSPEARLFVPGKQHFQVIHHLSNYSWAFGKTKVLALLDTGADSNFIEEKLANLIGLPAFGSLDVKVGNGTLTGTTPILQLVIIDLEGSPFRVMCNSSLNLSFPFILGFPWLRESLLNFDHPNNKISLTCNDIVKLLPLLSGTLCPIPSKLNLTTISSTILVSLSAKDKDELSYCYSNFKDHFNE
ncbi:hypothetical protein DSO57_1005010 [Entomophthora muscae]|uniref:Uncharacterized protein n=1 Tax=Entomophthora muscae TaxID=34485 RepID=A0ACC2TIP8_9FUNG|nr:hypothetical protein DSO57_1005010 [Entomophthora muscae]